MQINELIEPEVLLEGFFDYLKDKFTNYGKKSKTVIKNIINILDNLKDNDFKIDVGKEKIFTINKYVSELRDIVAKYIDNDEILKRISFIDSFFLKLASLHTQELIKQNITNDYDNVIKALNQLPEDIKSIIDNLNNVDSKAIDKKSTKVIYGYGKSTGTQSDTKIKANIDKKEEPKKEEPKKEEPKKEDNVKELDFIKNIDIIMKKINIQYKKEHGIPLSKDLYQAIHRILINVSNNK